MLPAAEITTFAFDFDLTYAPMALATLDTASLTVTLLIVGFMLVGTDAVKVFVLLPTDVPLLVYV